MHACMLTRRCLYYVQNMCSQYLDVYVHIACVDLRSLGARSWLRNDEEMTMPSFQSTLNSIIIKIFFDILPVRQDIEWVFSSGEIGIFANIFEIPWQGYTTRTLQPANMFHIWLNIMDTPRCIRLVRNISKVNNLKTFDGYIYIYKYIYIYGCESKPWLGTLDGKWMFNPLDV